MMVDCQRAIARLWPGFLALLVVVGAGCGRPEPPCLSEDPPPECNQCPIKLGLIPDDTLELDESVRRNVKDFFLDGDSGDVLVYTAESENESVVEVQMDGAVLTYTAVGVGESKVTVTAYDKEDCTAEQEFTVVVEHPNRPPSCDPVRHPIPSPIPIGTAGDVELGQYCSDPDRDDDITFSVDSSDPDVLRVSVSGSTLSFEALDLGTATVTITVTDLEGLTGTKEFDVTVVEEEG